MGQHMQGGRFGAAVRNVDANENVVGRVFGEFHENVEVALLCKDARVQQFVLRLGARTPAVCFHQIGVGKRGLRVFVEKLHV